MPIVSSESRLVGRITGRGVVNPALVSQAMFNYGRDFSGSVGTTVSLPVGKVNLYPYPIIPDALPVATTIALQATRELANYLTSILIGRYDDNSISLIFQPDGTIILSQTIRGTGLRNFELVLNQSVAAIANTYAEVYRVVGYLLGLFPGGILGGNGDIDL